MTITTKTKYILSFCLYIIIFVYCQTILYSVNAETSSAQQEKFNIAFITALSGDAASLGNASKNGATLAYESLSPAEKDKINLIFEDDSIDPKKTVAIFNRLLSKGTLDAVITWTSSTSKAVAPIAAKKNIPMIAIASDPEIPKGKNSVFNLWVTPNEAAKVLVSEVGKRGHKKIARVSTIQDGVLACNKAFDTLKSESIEIVTEEELPSTEKNFQTIITKIKSKNIADSIMLMLMPGQSGIFAKQMKELNVNLPLFSFEILESTDDLKIADGAFEGAIFAASKEGDLKFSEEYKNKFPEALSFSAPQSYDAVKLLAKFATESADKNQLINSLKTLKDYEGASGKFSADGTNRFTLPAMLKVIKGNEFLELK